MVLIPMKLLNITKLHMMIEIKPGVLVTNYMFWSNQKHSHLHALYNVGLSELTVTINIYIQRKSPW